MAREIGFGVVGMGMGRHHCTAINRADGARLAAICDADKERLDAGIEEFGCRGYTDYESFLADEAVEVVNIATPSGSHARLAIPAAEAGKHLVVEKPADITVERNRRDDRRLRGEPRQGRGDLPGPFQRP